MFSLIDERGLFHSEVPFNVYKVITMNTTITSLISDMDADGHMMDWDGWWGFPFMGMGMILIWLVFLVIGILVYRDAEKHGMNGLLWFILVIIPWIGIIALIAYLIIRSDHRTDGARYLPPPPPGYVHEKSDRARSARTILDERYAEGLVSREEYLQKKVDLGESPRISKQIAAKN